MCIRDSPSTVGDDLEETVVVEDNTTDLVTVKTLASSDSAPDVGDTVTFEITVTNSGPSDATNVSLTDTLPAGLTATGLNGGITQGSYDATTGLFNIGSLAVGQSATLTLEGTVDAGQGGNTITNITTAATGDQVDSSTAGDDLDESVAVNAPQVVGAGVGVAKQVVGTPVLIANGNFDVVYELIVQNTGDVDLANLSLLEDFAVAFGSAAIGGGEIFLTTPPSDPSSTIVTNLNLQTDVEFIDQSQPSLLAVGDSFTVRFTIQVDPDAAGAPTVFNNQVTITGEAVDSNGDPILDGSGDPVVVTDLSDSGADPDGNNIGADGDTGGSDDPTPTVFPAADLVTVKTLASGDPTPDVGDTVTFQIVVTNNGDSDASGVSLNDFLPAGLTATANNGTVSQGSYDAATGIFEIGDLAVGETATLTLEGTVDVGQGGNTITNITTAATGDQIDPSTVGDDLDESVVVNAPAPVIPDIDPVPPPVPETPVASGSIPGVVFQDNNNDGVQDAGEVGIAGVQIVLTGTDVFGNPVQRVVFTDANGVYTFSDLPEGNFTVTQIQPQGFDDGIDAGSGIVGNDVISDIQLGAGQVITGNTFGEVFPIITPVTPEGVTGNPPRLPGFLPANLAPIGNQTSFGAPGQIYSGIPINQNSDPLTLDSGRRVLGGFSVSDGFFNEGGDVVDCGCDSACDCGTSTPIEVMPVQPIIEEGCGCGPVYSEGEVPMGKIDGQILGPVIEQTPEGFFEGASTEDVEEDQQNENDDDIAENEGSDNVAAPSFLKRISSWITPTNDIKA